MGYWKTLFDDDELVCISENCYGTALKNIPDIFHTSYNFVSINPMHTKRADANVTCFRNILLEFDSIAPHEQLEIITNIPHTTVVWSGGKSYHCIISLQEPCKTREEYDQLVRAIYNKVPQVDKSAKNPSRFTRAPGVYRENGQEQTLVHVKTRVHRAELDAWLGPVKEESKSRELKKRLPLQLSLSTYKFLSNGCYGEGTGRNNMLFTAACDMCRASYSLSEAISMLLPCTDLREAEAIRTINSAYRTVKRD